MSDTRPFLADTKLSSLGLAGFLLFLLSAAHGAWADDYELGREAYLAGDYSEAFRVWMPLATEAHERAQFSVGTLYFEGRGVRRDLNESVSWFRLAAEQGYAPAQFNLGNAYKHGNGVEQDDRQANSWWQKAAEQEFAPAQFNLGTQYYFGRGIAQDATQAMSWYRRAAKNGHPRAQALFAEANPESSALASTPAPSPPAPSPAASSTSSLSDSTLSAATPSTSAPSTSAPSTSAPSTSAPSTSAPSTSAPSTSAPSNPASDAQGAQWVLEQDESHFTLQLIATPNEQTAAELIVRHGLGDRAALFEFSRAGEAWFAVAYGAFTGRPEAKQAIGDLPSELQQASPWIRSFSDIRKVIQSD